MKKIYILLLVFTAFAACKKSGTGPSAQGPNDKFIGKWNFVSVQTIFRDAAGTILGDPSYPNPDGSYFQFNSNGTWGSKFLADTSLGLNNRGFFTTSSDTSLTLSDTGKFAYTEKCKIYTFTSSLLLFSHTRNTLFNGVTPGTEEYVFKLTR